MHPACRVVCLLRSFVPRQVDRVARLYPGRAAMAPLLDLLITLLHWGASGWRAVLAQREALYAYAQQRLQQFAEQHGERLLDTPGNPISLALSLSSFEAPAGQQGQVEQQPAAEQQPAVDRQQPAAEQQQRQQPVPITFLGSMLFNRCISGTRVVARGKRQEVSRLRETRGVTGNS